MGIRAMTQLIYSGLQAVLQWGAGYYSGLKPFSTMILIVDTPILKDGVGGDVDTSDRVAPA